LWCIWREARYSARGAGQCSECRERRRCRVCYLETRVVQSHTSAAESIVSTMSDALLLVDGTGKIGAVNRALRKMTAYNESELVGRDVECVLEVAP